MQDFQQRVITEKAELDEKISKLSEFVRTQTFHDLPVDERVLLSAQKETMAEYSKILGSRIAHF